MFDALDSPQSIAAVWIGLALLASLVSIRLGISVALMEIFAGVFGGNVLSLETNEWINFVAGFGSVVLTFLAGAEVEPEVLRRRLKETLSIGLVSFAAPFLGAFFFAWIAAGWELKAAEIAGLALSTTSVAVVYAVMVETGLNECWASSSRISMNGSPFSWSSASPCSSSSRVSRVGSSIS